MDSFVYTSNPARVIFGSGTISQLPDELERQKLTAVLILSTPGQVHQAEKIKAQIGSKAAGIFSEAKMHTPVAITEKAVKTATELQADGVVSIGGGSTIGLGKAISIRTGLPHICIPTTYAGSEMTPILGETQSGEKTTRKDPQILPGTVIYDVDLTTTLPAKISAVSGVNALAHAIEALYAPDTNPIITLIAQEGIKSLAESLPQLLLDTSSSSSSSTTSNSARSKALYGAWLCATCLGTVTMSLHHKLCHTLGGAFDLPHAETHTILLPHTVAYNARAAPEAMRVVADALPDSQGDAVVGLNVLLKKLGVPRGLREVGMKEGDVDRGAELAVKNQYANPRPVEEEGVREVIRRAWAGEDASADI